MTEKISLKDGYVMIARKLYDEIVKYDFSKRELKVLLALIRYSYGYKRTFVPENISHLKLANYSNMPKSHFSASLKSLINKNIIIKDELNNLIFQKYYEFWGEDKKISSEILNIVLNSYQNGNSENDKSYQNGNQKVTKTVTKSYQNGNSEGIKTQSPSGSPAPLNKTLNKRYKKNIDIPPTPLTSKGGDDPKKQEFFKSNEESTKPIKGKESMTLESIQTITIELFDNIDIMPIVSEWLDYKKEKKQSYKPTGLKAFIKQLHSYSEGNIEKAKKIIETSMANNWAGIFELKEDARIKRLQKFQEQQQVATPNKYFQENDNDHLISTQEELDAATHLI